MQREFSGLRKLPLEPRANAVAETLVRARKAAWACGVSRIADLTHLDRTGLPVFQAVRPMGRALSVHQGKGADVDRAKISALMEAIESWHAETFVRSDVQCRYSDINVAERSPTFSDYCMSEPNAGPEYVFEWVKAERLGAPGHIHVPTLCVSLDFTHGLDAPLERSSNGLGAGSTIDEASLTGLYEQVERDAVGEWTRLGFVERCRTWCAPQLGWYADWVQHLEALGLHASLFRLPSIVGVPVFVFQLADLSPDGYGVWGSGCHNDPEIAMFKALSEGLQSRLTMIAGARDDLVPRDYRRFNGLGFGIAPPPDAVQTEQARECALAGGGLVPGLEIEQIVARLADRGYRHVCRVDLTDADIGIPVVKVFAFGLGNGERRRRVPDDELPEAADAP